MKPKIETRTKNSGSLIFPAFVITAFLRAVLGVPSGEQEHTVQIRQEIC